MTIHLLWDNNAADGELRLLAVCTTEKAVDALMQAHGEQRVAAGLAEKIEDCHYHIQHDLPLNQPLD